MKNFLLILIVMIVDTVHLSAQDNFPYPSVPNQLHSPQERAEYVVRHYWDGINFDDTTLIHKPGMIEQGFVNFIDLLPRLGILEKEGIARFAQSAFGKNPTYDQYMHGLAERYLYTASSPMRNDTLYIHLLEALNTLSTTTETEKEQNSFLISNLSKNMVGNVASNFEYVDSQGKKHRLSEANTPYIILYFYDPNCETCQEVEKKMTQDPLLKGCIGIGQVNNPGSTTNHRITLIKVNAMARRDLWRSYYFRSFPALYLLDANHRVLLKDTEWEKIAALIK